MSGYGYIGIALIRAENAYILIRIERPPLVKEDFLFLKDLIYKET
jgi:hypothetical protein